MIMLSLLFLTACQDDDNELGLMLDKSQVKFEVEQIFSIDEGGNTVVLRNLTPETVAIWDYGTGRSTRITDTVRFPFQGEYTIKFSAVTAGGIVAMDPVTIEVTADNLTYLSDPLWVLLTGGVGNEKTWILDNGNYGFATGPLSYADPSREQVWENFQLNYEPADVGQTEADLNAEMTFSLKGGPFFTTVKPNEEGGDESGTFSFDPAEHTLGTTDATIIRPAEFIANASNWTNDLNILTLTENQLQIAVYRTNSEGPWWYVLNYVSKEYAENYTPEEEEPSGPDEGFDPEFAPGELLKILTGGSASGRLWKLDAAGNPVDWLASGTGWTSSSDDSRDWGWNDSWDAVAESSWIIFYDLQGQNYTRNQGGVVTTGTFTLNEETNEISLNGNTLIQNSDPTNWMNPPVDQPIKVVKAFPEETLEKGIWFGTSYNADSDEWLAFHYIIPSN